MSAQQLALRLTEAPTARAASPGEALARDGLCSRLRETRGIALVQITPEAGLSLRRELAVARLLGARHAFIAIALDEAGYDYNVYRDASRDAAAIARDLGYDTIRCFPVSARRGDNLHRRGDLIDWYDGPTVLEAADE